MVESGETSPKKQLQAGHDCIGGGYCILAGVSHPNSETKQLSHEKNPLTFRYTGWLIGILIMVYYNPYITG